MTVVVVMGVALAAGCGAADLLSMQRWANRQGGFWNSQKWIAGDFNDDGKADIADIFDDSGLASIDVHPSTGRTFDIQRWTRRQGGFWDTQNWVAGDFDGDEATDIANIFEGASGLTAIDVHLSNGSSFGVQCWDTQQNGFSDQQKWIAGDFNDDGKTDLANVNEDGDLASIDVYLSDGNSFDIQRRWATRQGSPNDQHQWVSGDFNGDGKADLADVFNDGGLASIDMYLSNGGSFGIQRWVTQQGGFRDEQKWSAGDFDGDGRADLANVFNDGGLASIDIHLSNGSTVDMQRWATQQGGFWDQQKWTVGDFTGDHRADLLTVFNDDGRASIEVYRR